MRSIAVMDTFCSFGVCIEGDPRRGSPFSAQNTVFVGVCVCVCVCVFVGVCKRIVERIGPRIGPTRAFASYELVSGS